MNRDLRNLMTQMTLEEKAGLYSGLNFWKTKQVERLGIPSQPVTSAGYRARV